MSDSVRPHRRQPTRLPRPWDSPGKNTGVGCHFLLQCMKVKSEREVAQSCPTLSDPMDRSLPGSSVHGIFQARVLEWGAITYLSCLHLSLPGASWADWSPLWVYTEQRAKLASGPALILPQSTSCPLEPVFPELTAAGCQKDSFSPRAECIRSLP